MSKLTYEDKINLYIDKKKGMSIGSLSDKYKVSKNVINYLTALIDKHGIDILRTKKKENETDKEKIKRLEEENLYLKVELEYSKKLRAVVQARKNQQQKKK